MLKLTKEAEKYNMENYYDYFVNKGNQFLKRNDSSIGKIISVFGFNDELADRIIHEIIFITRKYHKPIATRIIYKDSSLRNIVKKKI